MTALPLSGVSAVALALTLSRSAIAMASEVERPRDAPLAGAAAVLPPIPDAYLRSDDAGFAVAYHPAARERVRAVLPLLGAMRDELRTLLGAPVLGHVELRVGALPSELDRLAPERAEPQSSLGGLSYGDLGLVVLAAHGGIDADFESSVRHHLAHLALDESVLAPSADGASPPRGDLAAIPVWFHEGFAVHFAGERDGERAQILAIALLTGDTPSLARIERARPGTEASAGSADFVRFAAQEQAVVPSLVSGVRAGLPFDHALETAFGAQKSSIDDAWKREMRRRYTFVPALLLVALLFLVVWATRALRKRRFLRALEAARVAAELDPAISIRPRKSRQQRLSARATETDDGDASAHPPEVPRVEHDGDWHTLH